MFVNIGSIYNDNSVTENIEITTRDSFTVDEFGRQIMTNDKNVETLAIIVAKTERGLDVQRNTYVNNVVYDFYIPANTVIGINPLSGCMITREDGSKYQITNEPIRRRYISHIPIRATEVKFQDDIGNR